jgi:hypothetical protein
MVDTRVSRFAPGQAAPGNVDSGSGRAAVSTIASFAPTAPAGVFFGRGKRKNFRGNPLNTLPREMIAVRYIELNLKIIVAE